MAGNASEFIKKTLLFSRLSSTGLEIFKAMAQERHYDKGEIIFSEGDDAKGFFTVVEGLVRIFKISPQGKEQTLHLLGPGEPFGEAAVFFDLPVYPAFATAVSDLTALFFPKDTFIDGIRSHPDIAISMLGVLSMRLHAFTRMIEDLSLKEVPSRIAAYLLMQVRQGRTQAQDPTTVELNVSKNLLSTVLGTSPETLSRAFKRMEQRGIIQRQGDASIRIKDLSLLADIAEGIKRLV